LRSDRISLALIGTPAIDKIWLRPVWMQSIFGLLEEYHGIAEYFHFE
jgi:hypothetical protein